nr:hypothetical protein [Tanacetum cinerariifolium]
MTTPRPTTFSSTTPRGGVLVPFVIISDSNNEITTLPVRPAPPSPDHTPALYGYPLDSGDDSSDKDLSEIVESLHTQTASTSVVHPPPTRPLPTSPAFARRLGKEISMPLGYKAAMDRWKIQSTLTITTTINITITLPSPPPAPPPPVVVPPSPEHIESVEDDIKTLRASLASAMQETMPSMLEFNCWSSTMWLLKADRRRARRTDMTEQDIETLRTRAETAEQQAETLQVALGAARMDVNDLIESCETDMFEMAELRSRAQDIEASF